MKALVGYASIQEMGLKKDGVQLYDKMVEATARGLSAFLWEPVLQVCGAINQNAEMYLGNKPPPVIRTTAGPGGTGSNGERTA